jgi:hypothetical protein
MTTALPDYNPSSKPDITALHYGVYRIDAPAYGSIICVLDSGWESNSHRVLELPDVERTAATFIGNEEGKVISPPVILIPIELKQGDTADNKQGVCRSRPGNTDPHYFYIIKPYRTDHVRPPSAESLLVEQLPRVSQTRDFDPHSTCLWNYRLRKSTPPRYWTM